MPDPQQVLAARVRDALGAALGADYASADPLIRPSAFADFQSNAALPLARKLGRPPRDIASEIVGRLEAGDICAPPTVSGPGFINFTLREEWIAGSITGLLADPRLGTPLADPPRTVIVEYSSPNIAKEMHVGHLRTTIVGDAIARVIEFAGHHVIRDNHVGDWGTQFGMLIEYLFEIGEEAPEAQLLRTDPNTFYQSARTRFDSDPDFADRCRDRVVKLQSGGDPATQRLWDEYMELSRQYLRDIYALLRVTLTDDDIRGESFYNDMLGDVAADLTAKGLAVLSEGALCVFPPGFTGRDGGPLPVIIRKRDGGYNYSTTDLATVRYRVDKLHCDRAIYVVGSDQALHFRMVFAVAREAGWLAADADFEHAQIGMVQGTDGNRLRTREGDTVKLSALLAEGVDRARAILSEIDGLDAAAKDEIAEDVGIGAIKYADLSTALDSAYIFDWDRMISFRGNTGPYLQYATTRIRSIFRKAGIDEAGLRGPVVVTAPAERELALKLLGFGAAVTGVAETAEPHRLCAYVFEVASLFTAFYEQCPVLKADDEQTRQARLALCAATLRVLTAGLGLLGVPIPERM
ncbi:arginine--tRNA ligase [Trebonia sp.]|uniref:arginine--tRNA ligase n=1 Tax=Trebonia sp. TaxID=2767075 RepID=UPI00261C1B4C|nr:arginine--tRNA ligase [Trebonia sp.]